MHRHGPTPHISAERRASLAVQLHGSSSIPLTHCAACANVDCIARSEASCCFPPRAPAVGLLSGWLPGRPLPLAAAASCAASACSWLASSASCSAQACA